MRIIILCIVIGAIIGAIFYLEMKKPGQSNRDVSVATSSSASPLPNTDKAKKYESYKEISTPDGFINATSVSVGEFIGKKVVLVDFWTYSCINCQRTTPYLNAWYEKYKDAGLVIIGVHTPEFDFEKKYDNVAAAVKKFNIRYPVVLDNDFSTWNAYGNRYWPRKYLIDIDGYVVYNHIGEGGYEETEHKIQEALEERMAQMHELHNLTEGAVAPSGVISVESGRTLSPETYFGSGRNALLANGTLGVAGVQQFAEPSGAKPDTLYLAGSWNIQDEYARNETAGAKIIYRYHARNVYMVVTAEKPVRATISVDGIKIKTITFAVDGLYPLLEGDVYGEHTLEIILDDPGLRVFTFTFG